MSIRCALLRLPAAGELGRSAVVQQVNGRRILTDWWKGGQYMNINQVPALNTYQNALNALGFSGETSLEQLIGAAQVAGPELAAYLERVAKLP
jgi:hypothetical protein